MKDRFERTYNPIKHTWSIIDNEKHNDVIERITSNNNEWINELIKWLNTNTAEEYSFLDMINNRDWTPFIDRIHYDTDVRPNNVWYDPRTNILCVEVNNCVNSLYPYLQKQGFAVKGMVLPHGTTLYVINMDRFKGGV